MSLRLRETRSALGLAAGIGSVLLTTLACSAQTVRAQEPASETSQAVQPSTPRLTATQQQLALVDDRFAKLSAQDMARLTSFVVGNLYFVVVHELGHAVISQLKLPVLGREEDAADSFATLSMLFIGTELSHTVLREAARGLWLVAHRDKSTGQVPAAYDEHGLDMQRAYQIVCLMVGSDPKGFREVATIAKIPPERQETCVDDFAQAADSWESLLNERSSDTSKSRFFARLSSERKGSADIRVRHSGPEDVSGYQKVLQAAGVLETVARFGGESLALPRPITIKAMKCDEPNAYWDDKDREITVCVELVGEFIDLGLRALQNN